MKVIVKENENKKDGQYPKLMKSIHCGSIIMFINNKEGTVISSDNYHVGTYHSDWLYDSFIPFNGTVELSND